MNEEKDTREENLDAAAKKKKIKRVEKSVLSVLLALVIVAVGFVAGWFGRWGALGKKKQSLLWAIDVAEENYYRDLEDALYDNLFASFGFDPYSGYYTAEEYETVVNEWNGQNLDAGFSVYTEEKPLQVYQIAAGSSAADAGIRKGMYFLKFGKTEETLKSGNAEDYFTFVANLKTGDTYCVLCGDSENESEATCYTLENGADGAGISLTRTYDPMRVYQVVGNSPADKAGLKRGMYILGYGASDNKEEMTAGSSADFFTFVKSLRPDNDGNIFFWLKCSFDKDDADASVYKLTMAEYQASYCFYRDNKVSYRFRTKEGSDKDKKPEAVLTDEPLTALDDDTAYICLSEFTGNAAAEFKECLQKMKDNNRKNLILDLRGNGGGRMNVFAEIASYLLKDATAGTQKVAYAKFKNGATVSYSVKGSYYKDYFGESSRISILADEYTASASECLIGALIDYKTISFSDVYLHRNGKGEARTYGKGIMQTTYEGPSGSALKLTSAEIFWPKSGKTIHGVGVTTADGANAILSTLLPDSTDSFLQEAIGVIKNKPTVSPDAPSVSV